MIAVVNANNQEGQHMGNLIQSLGDAMVGTLRGFDRLVFKGAVRRFMFSQGAMNFLASQGVLNKDFKTRRQGTGHLGSANKWRVPCFCVSLLFCGFTLHHNASENTLAL